MKAQELKNAILQLAVQGKLVPQDPKDEPASALLSKIRAEKEKLIKAAKLKKEKNPSEIFINSDGIPYEKFDDGKIIDISPEIPFAIPPSWQWVRLIQVSKNIHYGFTASAEIFGNTKLLRITDIQENSVDWETVPFCSTSEKEYETYGLNNRDIMIARTGGTIGKTYIVRNLCEKVVFASYLIRAIPIDFINEEFIKIFMESPLYWTQLLEKSMGTGQPNVNGEKLKSLLLPLPPRMEQNRIVAKIEELLPHIEQYGKAETELRELQKRFPDDLKKSILQSAIQGKLVPQDPTDEPAEVLLERIRTEKLHLIKSGKIKPSKNESTIFCASDRLPYEKYGTDTRCIEDELPFQIPSSWQWVRLSDSCEVYTGNSINEQEKAQKYSNISAGRHYIATKDIGFDGKIHYRNGIKIPQDEIKFRLAPTQSTLMCIEGGSSGRKIGFLKEDVCFGNKLCAFVPHKILCPQFLFYYLQTPQFLTEFKANETGIIGGTSISKIKTLFLPLPPIAEQMRIVAKIEKLLCYNKELSD